MAVCFSLPNSLQNITNNCFTPKKAINESVDSDSSLWSGRIVTTFKDGVSFAVTKTVGFASKTLTVAKYAVDDANMTATFFRKMDNQIIHMIAALRGVPADTWGKFREGMRSLVGVVDFAQLAVEIDYFTGCRFKKDCANKQYLQIGAHTGFSVAELGGGTLWLNDLGLINLGEISAKVADAKIFSFIPKITAAIPGLRDSAVLHRIANSVGELRVLSFVNKISLISVTLRALALGYFFLAVDAITRIIDQTRSAVERTSATFDFSSFAAELVLDALILTGVTNIWGLGTAAVAAVIFGALSLAYRKENEKALEDAEKSRQKPVQTVKV